MRYELGDNEWTAIKPMLPNKPRGVRRVNDLLPQTMLLADRGYDANWIRALARQQGAWRTFRRKQIAKTRSASARIGIANWRGERSVTKKSASLLAGGSFLSRGAIVRETAVRQTGRRRSRTYRTFTAFWLFASFDLVCLSRCRSSPCCYWTFSTRYRLGLANERCRCRDFLFRTEGPSARDHRFARSHLPSTPKQRPQLK
jgi:transposase